MSEFISIEEALKELQAGQMLILVDAEDRENEGDLMMAAEKITPEAMNFLTKHGRGQLCLALHPDIIDRLQIPMMPERNKLPNQASFTASVEAAYGVTTGVSVFDRAHTVQVVVNPESKPSDISIPGHIFPLRARPGGILERSGHTEGSVDLAKLAGMQPAAVICEMMNEDGSMSRLENLFIFSKKHNIKLVAINDLIAYRLQQNHLEKKSDNIPTQYASQQAVVHAEIETNMQVFQSIVEMTEAPLPLESSPHWKIKIFKDYNTGLEHPVMLCGNIDKNKPVLVRLHSECFTGDVLRSLKCDCGDQLQTAIDKISENNGVILYMRQEGRGIGLVNKIKAYKLQSQGYDTIEANHQLGFVADARDYQVSAHILRAMGIYQIRLLTNNPDKVDALKQCGITSVERIPLEVLPCSENIHYLKTKRDKLNHMLVLDDGES